ncbi:MAG: heavy-metal-associated domain-containing protein [Spirochaetales bacterium]|nr:heavy-metal-associated domain-containing protein [Spirochaetales bacterium]
MKKTITIDGMSCEHCVMHVKKALEQLDGVSKVTVKIGEASLETPEDYDLSTLKDAVREAGYTVVQIS